MSSNAYVASDGKTVMKVGKTNNFWKREKQISLPMTAIIFCPDELTAFLIERELRRIAIEMGGVRHPARVDWFEFDSDIHLMLQAFVESLNGFTPASIDGPPTDEIVLRRKQYVQQLKAMQQKMVREYLAQRDDQVREMRELRRQIAHLEEEHYRLNKELANTREQLQKEIQTEREKNYELIWEARDWEGKYIELRSYAKTLGFIKEDTDI